jgi:hypothetical protein
VISILTAENDSGNVGSRVKYAESGTDHGLENSRYSRVGTIVRSQGTGFWPNHAVGKPTSIKIS